MKKIILLALASLPAVVFAQNNKFSIQGTVGTLNAPAKVYLRYDFENKAITDSAIITNGKFQFSGPAKADGGLISGNIILNKNGTGVSYNDWKNIYLEAGTITVTADNDMASAKITGTKTNDEKAQFDVAYKVINDGFEALDAKEKAAPDDVKNSESFQREIHKAQKELQKKSSQLDADFVRQHPDSYLSPLIIQSVAYSADYPEVAALYEGLSPRIKATETTKKFAEMLPKIKAVALGAKAPEFAEADTSGKMVSLSSFRGKYLLVDFWASWCGPCRGENPNVVKAYNHYKNQNFTILGVSLDQPNGKNNWVEAIKHDGLTWTQVSDLKYWNSEAAGLYAVHGIPQNFLLDPNGKIIAKNLRGDDLNDKLEELFGK